MQEDTICDQEALTLSVRSPWRSRQTKPSGEIAGVHVYVNWHPLYGRRLEVCIERVKGEDPRGGVLVDPVTDFIVYLRVNADLVIQGVGFRLRDIAKRVYTQMEQN